MNFERNKQVVHVSSVGHVKHHPTVLRAAVTNACYAQQLRAKLGLETHILEKTNVCAVPEPHSNRA